MNDRQLDTLLRAYFAGTIGREELVLLDRILRETEAARERFEELAGHEVDLRDVVVERLAPRRMARSRFSARLRLWAPLAAAASLLAVLGWWAFRGAPDGVRMATGAGFKIETIVGAVSARRGPSEAPVALRAGETVRQGTTIETGRGQSLALVCAANRLRIELAQDSQWIWPEQPDETEVLFRLPRGRLTASATPAAAGPGLRFRTSQADIRVTGTQLDILAGDNETRVDVAAGRVDVKTVAATTWSAVTTGQTALLSGTEEQGALALLGDILFEDTFGQGLGQWMLQEEREEDILRTVEGNEPMAKAVRIVEDRFQGRAGPFLEISGLAAKDRTFNLRTKQSFPMENLAMEIEFAGADALANSFFRAGCAVQTPIEVEAPRTEVLFEEPFRMRMNRWYVRRGAYRPSVDEQRRLVIHTENYQDGRRVFAHRSDHGTAAEKAFHAHITVRNMTLRVNRVTVRHLLAME